MIEETNWSHWWVVTNKRQYADLPPWPEALQSALTLMHEEEQP